MNRLIKQFLRENNERKLLFSAFATLVCTIIFSILVFFGIYSVFIDSVLYNERLSQMNDVTTQLFSNLEIVVQNQWQNVNIHHTVLKNRSPQTVDEFIDHMRTQSDEFSLSEQRAELFAVDSLGRYYTNNGRMGKLSEMSYLDDSPEFVSFETTPLLYNEPKMNFLKRLSEPLVLRDGAATVKIIYYGLSEDMEILPPYLECDAYDGNNTVYVMNEEGFRLFQCGKVKLFQAYNILNKLSKMEYLHGSSFEDTMQKLDEDGIAYSNAIVDGTEYYYALKKMENTKWTLLFLVPSEYVANNTVLLINATVRFVLIFSVLLGLISAVVIYLVMRLQQQKALNAERANNELLTRVNQKLEVAVHEADSANKAKSDFLANMSHDIRTPMNAIIGITTLMEHEPNLSEKMLSYIYKVQLSSRHLLGLINDVLDMSKIESSSIKLNDEHVSLAEQIRQLDGIIRPQVNERKQQFVIRIHNIVHENLHCDGVRLRQVLLNLLSNAVKYTQEHGCISLDICELPCEMPAYAKFTFMVSDNGYGMSPEFLPHIFEPFTRAEDSTTNKVHGTGLGMAITKNIVELMGGKIEVESTPNSGSRFKVTVSLPIQEDTEEIAAPHNIAVISEDPSIVENLHAATLYKPVNVYPFVELTDFSEMPDKKSIDIILIANALHTYIAPEIYAKLRRLCSEHLLIFGVDYPGTETEQAAFRAKNVDGFIPRPMFYSDLEAAIDKANSARNISSKKESVLNGMNFLCAEDNELNAEILKELLAMHGATCTIYPDGQALVDAFASVHPGEYDAILMDVQMPKLNGLDAAKAIRNGRNPLGKELPIIAMTANAFSEDVQRSIAAGMNAHISKPLDITLLEKVMRKLTAAKTE